MALEMAPAVTPSDKRDSCIRQYCALGCITLITPRSPVSGMCYLMQRSDVWKALPKYVEDFFDTYGQYPIGPHVITLGSDKRRKFKFPDNPRILGLFRDTGHLNEHDFGKWLSMDWYIHGTSFHPLSDDDPPELILRCPLRNDSHIDAAAKAIVRIWPDVLRADDPHQHSSTYKPLPFGAVRDILSKAESNFCRREGYPPNLAALWRLESPEIPQIMRRGIEAYGKRYFRGTLNEGRKVELRCSGDEE